MFRRKSTDTVEPVEAAPETPAVRSARAYTAGKGRPTPKRTEAAKTRKVESAPKNSKEAKTRMRAKMRAERAEAYEGVARGDEKYLTSRDRGPVRRLVRDLIDARRNIATYFLVGAFLVVLLTSGGMPPAVRFGGQILWLLMIIAIVVDVFLISRLVRKTVKERFPKSTEKTGAIVFYGVMRSVQFRRMRSPKPQVELGAHV
jgi:hypothetical protein